MFRAESLRKPLYPIAMIGLVLFMLTAHLYLRGWGESADMGTCKSVYMYPSYARIKSFDETHTRYASKYSLYLYREQGLDHVPSTVGEGFDALDGTPVLFIPGNAGLYRQVRSIAAECSILYFDENIDVVDNANQRNLDFFAADFNEDFTAFHGRTLLDQAEYLNEAVRFILLLYALNKNPPSSVLILAHSMGGIVARVMLTLPSYLPGSINTMVTLASPHAASPLTFDSDILKIYLATDRFWHHAFADNESLAHSRLHNVLVISITGGVTDSILPADYTTLGFLVPPSNGLTVYTTGIPGVWTPMDHLAIVWCRQLRRSILKALLEIVDFSSPHRVYPLERRMAVFKQNLLSGFENTSRVEALSRRQKNSPFKLKFDVQDAVVQNGANGIWKSSQALDSSRDQIFNILPLTETSTVLMLSSHALKIADLLDSIGLLPYSAFLCKKDGEAENLFDLTNSNTKEFLELTCIDVASDYNQIPRSATSVDRLENSAFDGEAPPFWALHYKPEDIRGFENLLVVHNREISNKNDGFMIAQTSESDFSEHTVRGDMFSLITRGVEVSLLANRPLAVNLNIPGAWSSILAYKVELKESSGDLFEPFIRQWVEDPYETKWIIRLRGHSKFLVNMHGVAPFTPFSTQKPTQGLNLQLWSDPQGGWSDDNVAAVELTLSVDWINSLKLLVLRYRLALVSHSLAVTVLVSLFQFLRFTTSGKFPDYTYGLSRVTSLEFFIPTILALWILSPVAKLTPVKYLLNILDPVVFQDPNEINLTLKDDFKLNSFYLGLEENCLSFIGPIFYTMAIGINLFIYYLFANAGLLIGTLVNLSKHAHAFLPKIFTPRNEPNKSEKSFGKKIFASAFLLLLIPFYLPYQFAYVISFAIHATTCIKVLVNKSSRSCWNFNMSILMVMAWVLPINIPVLVVFVHNLNVSWATPFSSHHNFLAVAPVLLMVELCSYFDTLMPIGSETGEKFKESWVNKVSLATLAYLVVYSLIYGTRHTFWLHHLFNFWCCSICLMIFNCFNGDAPEKIQ